jgi:hypothetical protein
MFGEALCEKCERQRSPQLGRDNYWADLRGDVLWLTGKLAAIFGRFKFPLATAQTEWSGRTSGREVMSSK